MNVYMQADFDALTRDADGYLHVPTGDWSAIKFNGANKLIFESGCKLGYYCTLGKYCALGNGCKLGIGCTLGDGCTLGGCCTLGEYCALGNGCTLGNYCTLGKYCALGDGCKLGNGCALGDGCALGVGCSLENGKVQNATFFKTSNIGSRNDATYCYCNTVTGNVYVRSGCWFSGVDDFVKRVHKVHAGTQHEKDYMALVEFAKARFELYKNARG